MMEFCLVAVIFYHGINGLRVIIANFLRLTRLHKIFFWLGILVFIIALVLTLLVFLPHIMK